MVLRWDGVSQFVDVPAVYDVDPFGNVVSRLVDTDLSALGVSPSACSSARGMTRERVGRGSAMRSGSTVPGICTLFTPLVRE